MKPSTIHRCEAVTVYVTPAGGRQVYITASLLDATIDTARACEATYQQICDILTTENLQIVHERIFGSIDAHETIIKAREKVMRENGQGEKSAVTYIQGRPLWGKGLAGVSIQAVRATERGDDIWPIYDGQEVVGTGWRQNGATYLVLQNIHGLGGDGDDRQSQARRMFDKAVRILQEQGAGYDTVVRTWIYLSGLLDWYDQLNEVRNKKYIEVGLMDDPAVEARSEQLLLPASTGIEGDNPLSAACIMDAMAIVRDGDAPLLQQLTNAKQQDAFLYGSAFSRGACVSEKDFKAILISGTAAIDEAGKSMYPGDVRAQIKRTFDNVLSLIAGKGGKLQDICDANIFIKEAKDVEIYREVVAELGLAEMPAVIINADVCRKDLLFELDATAVISS